MSYEMPPDTKYAAIHLTGCSASDDIGDALHLYGDLSAHPRSTVALSAFDDERIGSDRAKAFRESNLVLMASMPSATATIRDAEWKTLEQHVFMLLYALLMHGVPNWRAATIAQGGRDSFGRFFSGRIRFQWYFRNHCMKPLIVGGDMLRRTGQVVAGLYAIHAAQGEFKRVKRGIYRMSRAWREELYLLDRLHEFVRALDGLMKLPKGEGEDEFVRRFQLFAQASNVEQIAREVYRLRSIDEHLSEWPTSLGYVKKDDRDRFVAERAFQVELVAGCAYRSILTDIVMRESFRDDLATSAFWSGPTTPLSAAVDLDALAEAFIYTPEG